MPATTVNREEFLHQIESVQAGLSSQGIIEQTNCLVFEGGKVSSYNEEVYCECPTKLSDAFKGAVLADPVLKLIRNLPDTNLQIEFTEKEMCIEGKRKQYSFTLSGDLLPRATEKPRSKKWRSISPDFGEAVGIIAQVASTDESQFEVSCVHLHPNHIEATDNNQIARYKMETGLKSPLLAKGHSIKNIAPFGMTEVNETDSWVHFRNGAELVIACRRFTDTQDYPDLGPSLECKGHPLALPKSLAKAAKRLEIFSSEDKKSNFIRVELSKGKIVLRAEASYGKGREPRHKINYKGEPNLFFIPPKLLIEIVTKHNECEINEDHLRIDTGKFVYVTSLGKEGSDDDKEKGSD